MADTDLLATFPGWATLDLQHGNQQSGKGSGVMLVKKLRDPLWSLHAESWMLSPNALRMWKATLDAMDNGEGLFLGYDFASYWPAAYPGGTWGGDFTGLTATILAIGGDGKSISLAGLPAGFRGSPGDMLAAAYGGASPPALALWRAVQAFLADGAGHTDLFAVRGAIPAGVAAGNTVAVKAPACRMMIVPDSITTPKDATGWGTIAFDGLEVPGP